MGLKAFRSLCLTLCLSLAGAVVSAAPFVSTHGYTVTPPPGWTVNTEADDDANFVYPAGALAGLTPSAIIKVGLSPAGMTMASLTAKLVSGFKKALRTQLSFRRRLPRSVVRRTWTRFLLQQSRAGGFAAAWSICSKTRSPISSLPLILKRHTPSTMRPSRKCWLRSTGNSRFVSRLP